MSDFERHAFSKTQPGSAMAPFWRNWAAELESPVEYAGASADPAHGDLPKLYVIIAEPDRKREVQQAVESRLTATIAALRDRPPEDLYSQGDRNWHPGSTGLLFVEVFAQTELADLHSAYEAEQFRRSPGRTVTARHPAEVASIEDYSPVEFHIFYRTSEIRARCDADGTSTSIAREIIAHLHQLGRTAQTLENTRFIFTCQEELSRDFIGFYR